MRNEILNTLKTDLLRLEKVKNVTFRALSLDEINYSNTPLVMIFALSEDIKRFENTRISTFEIGVSCVLYADDRNPDKLKDTIEIFVEDVKRWIDGNLDLYKIDGVEYFDLIKISPVFNAGDDLGIVEFIFQIVYVN